jgi:deoxycytidine triphosphate deaminase
MGNTFDFVKTEAEADQRAKDFKSVDPFESAPRALLSSAEIFDYVRATAMIHPFDEEKLKPASYEVRAGGDYIMWDADGRRQTNPIVPDKGIVLQANSIAFVQTEPKFRLPHYIAIRFNLRITHVHRGLLLGTGPLVDPGFQGRLLIPLHNLTDEDYHIDVNEGLIWVEFTKTTFGFSIEEKEASQLRHFKPFPERKNNKDYEYYFEKANHGNPIRSSIAGIIAENKRITERAADKAKDAAASAEDAKNISNNIQKLTFRFGFIGLLGVAAALAAVVVSSYSIVMESNSLTTSVLEKIALIQKENVHLNKRIEDLQKRLEPHGVNAENRVLNKGSSENHEIKSSD